MYPYKCKVCDQPHNNEGTGLCNTCWSIINSFRFFLIVTPTKLKNLFAEMFKEE